MTSDVIRRAPTVVWDWLRGHTATIGFLILSGAVIWALSVAYNTSQDNERAIQANTAAIEYICETTKIIDAAAVQLSAIDTQALTDKTLSAGEQRRLIDRIDVFNNLHDALVNDQPCHQVE